MSALLCSVIIIFFNLCNFTSHANSISGMSGTTEDSVPKVWIPSAEPVPSRPPPLWMAILEAELDDDGPSLPGNVALVEPVHPPLWQLKTQQLHLPAANPSYLGYRIISNRLAPVY